MEIKILSPLWGHEHLALKVFLDKIKTAGYDGIDTWVPDNLNDKRVLFDYLQQHEMYIVTHQHSAKGCTFNEFKESFIKNLYKCAEPRPLLINSHTGRDYFSLQQNLELVDAAQEFSEKTGINVAHETHRGRVGYSPQMISTLFEMRSAFQITADFSHWVCVTESMLENFTATVDEAIKRSRHIHARVGFEQGPQVADPRAPEWKYALNKFLGWWDKIVVVNTQINTKILPVTTEFGPVPYMPTIPFTSKPVADQFTINNFMKDLLNNRYRLI
ncbi:MAG: Xylose isomerase domain protein barrel [Mucilaginibacter sp.]|nr:Xylose isomerase domain protein barrel [Mucilaginibacter sp.]